MGRNPAITRKQLTPALIALLGFLAATGPLSTDLYLPTFPDMASDLGIPAGQVQLTLTGFLIGLGAGPLIVGPLSDRFGRRRVLLISLTVFVLTGIGMVLVAEIWVLIALRVVQGAAGAAATVISRTIVVDLAPGAKAVRPLSIIVFAVGLGAMVAAPVGGFAGSLWGWRGALFTLVGIGALMLVLAALFLPESLRPDQRHERGTSPLAALTTALKTPSVFAYALTLAAMYAAMMSFISASPFVASVVMGMTPQGFAWGFAASASAMLVASLSNAFFGARIGPVRMLIVAQVLVAVASLTFLTLTIADALTPPLFFTTGFLVISGFGITMANTTALALDAAGAARGSASALLSTTQYSIGALATPIVGLWGAGTALPMSLTIMVSSCLGISVAAVARRRHRRRLG